VLTPMLLRSWLDPEHLIHLLGPYALWGVAFIVVVALSLLELLLHRRQSSLIETGAGPTPVSPTSTPRNNDTPVRS
jgi:hypothetical protein